MDTGLAKDTSIAVRALDPEDRPAVVELLRVALGRWPIIEGVEREWDAEAFFDWKHRRSPFGPSYLILAEQNGSIVGVRAFMPRRMAAGEVDIDALHSTDSATLPSLQRSGVFALLRAAAGELIPAGAHFSFGTPNRKSYGATMKLGGREVVEVIRPWVRVAVSRVALAMTGRRNAEPDVDAPPASEALLQGGPISALLQEIRAAETRLTTARSVPYLRWRYGEAPLEYHGLADETGGTLRGMVLFRMRRARNLPQAVVEELMVRPGDRGTAMRLLRRVAAATQAPLLCCRFPSPSAQRIAAATSGFLPRRDGLPLVVKRLTDDGPEITGPGRWALTLGDVEVF